MGLKFSDLGGFTDRSFAWEEDSRAGDRTNFNLQCHHKIPSDCQSTFYRVCFSLFLLSVLPQPSILKLWLPSPQSSDYPHLQKNQNLNICVHGNKTTLLKLFMAIQLNLCSWVFSNVCHWTKFQWSLVTAVTTHNHQRCFPNSGCHCDNQFISGYELKKHAKCDHIVWFFQNMIGDTWSSPAVGITGSILLSTPGAGC